MLLTFLDKPARWRQFSIQLELKGYFGNRLCTVKLLSFFQSRQENAHGGNNNERCGVCVSQIICAAFMCLQVPKPKTTRYGKNSVKYLAAITWNKISDTLRFLSTLSAFKKAVRQQKF